MRNPNKPVGWRREPVRHGLAAKGISTTSPKSEAMSKVPAKKDVFQSVELLPGERTEMEELKIFIDNDYELYRSRRKPIIESLVAKMRKGTYDPEKSPKLFYYLVQDGARKYGKENEVDYKYILSTKVRRQLAIEMAREFEQEYKNGEIQ